MAPFRGFLEERVAQAACESVGPALLFFGSRDSGQDFLYEAELRDYVARGLTGLVTAFSRVAGAARVYMQDAIAAHTDEVRALLERGATVYLCGEASRMAPAVRVAFGAIYQRQTGADEAQAEAWLNGSESAGRYLADVWASE